MKRKLAKYIFNIDGHEAKTDEDNIMGLINYLLGERNMWKDVATTYKKSIDLIHEGRINENGN